MRKCVTSGCVFDSKYANYLKRAYKQFLSHLIKRLGGPSVIVTRRSVAANSEAGSIHQPNNARDIL